jgi:Ni2+-binding GTPase involved in maturation of urease and hydrogenase
MAILSVTEGKDKPLKDPEMFNAARLAILTKLGRATLRRGPGGL